MVKKSSKSKKDTTANKAEVSNVDMPSAALPDAFALFEPSANLVLKNFSEFVWLFGVPFVLAVLSVIERLFTHPSIDGKYHASAPLLSLNAIALIVALLVAPGIIVLELACMRNKVMSAGEAFREGLHHFWRMLGLSIVLVIALVVAFFLLIVPFFILLPRVVMSPYYLIDKDMGIMEAISASNNAYKKYHGVWGILGVSILVNLPAVIPYIGSIISTCLNFLYQPAFVLRYGHYDLLDSGKDPITPFEATYKG